MLTRQNDNDDFFRGLMNYKYLTKFKQGGFLITIRINIDHSEHL